MNEVTVSIPEKCRSFVFLKYNNSCSDESLHSCRIMRKCKFHILSIYGQLSARQCALSLEDGRVNIIITSGINAVL